MAALKAGGCLVAAPSATKARGRERAVDGTLRSLSLRQSRLHLHLSEAPQDTRLRACGCSFCRAHNTRTISDPHGSVEIWPKTGCSSNPIGLARALPSS
jgi:hypothetical protein